MSKVILPTNTEDQAILDQLQRCGDVALTVIEKLANHDNVVGAIDMQNDESYNDIVEEIVNLFIEKEVLFSEVDHIMNMVQQPLDIIKNRLLFSNSQTFYEAVKAKFGKDRMDLTVKELLEAVRQ